MGPAYRMSHQIRLPDVQRPILLCTAWDIGPVILNMMPDNPARLGIKLYPKPQTQPPDLLPAGSILPVECSSAYRSCSHHWRATLTKHKCSKCSTALMCRSSRSHHQEANSTAAANVAARGAYYKHCSASQSYSTECWRLAGLLDRL